MSEMNGIAQASREDVMARCFRPNVVAWVVVETEDGRHSICPAGWHMTTSFEPPMVAVSLAPSRYTHDLVEEASEFVLAFPGEDLAEITLDLGTSSGQDVDKFEAHGLTFVPGAHNQSPLVRDCIVNLECQVVGRMQTGDHTLFVGEILGRWQSPDMKRPLLVVDDSRGYDQLIKRGRYQLGAVRR